MSLMAGMESRIFVVIDISLLVNFLIRHIEQKLFSFLKVLSIDFKK